MRIGSFRPCRLCSCTGGVRAFTLIELLTVVAIIALLIGILVPSLGSARDSAKKVKSKAAMKSIGDGLEGFAGENSNELKGNNYPPSRGGDDPTVEDDDQIGMQGASWAVRYLLGKDFRGYIPPTQAKAYVYDGDPAGTQVGWYEEVGGSNPNPKLQDPNIVLPRAGPYLAAEAVTFKAPRDLSNRAVPPVNADIPREKNPVFVDAFDNPILYYAANSRHAASAKANIVTAKYPSSGGYVGVYSFGDNAFFTGGNSCRDFPTQLCIEFKENSTPKPVLLGDGKLGPLRYLLDEATPPATADDWREAVTDYPNSFAAYVLDKAAFEASGEKTVVPVRRDSFILFSPGKDGLFGTKDDIKNWD